MKKTLLSILALLTASMASLSANTVDLKAEFKYEQEEALAAFVKSWLKPDVESVLNSKLSTLLAADTRYRQVAKDTGLVSNIWVSLSKMNTKELSAADKLNLFMMSYFKETKGLTVDTRSVFSKTPYTVNR